MVISDYGRAKSLFAGTDIKIFKRGVLTIYHNKRVQLLLPVGAPLTLTLTLF